MSEGEWKKDPRKRGREEIKLQAFRKERGDQRKSKGSETGVVGCGTPEDFVGR